MSDVFGEILADVQGVVGPAGLDKSYLSSIVRAGVDAGVSANQMLRGLQTTGLGVQRQSFLRLVANTRAQVSEGALADVADVNALPSEMTIVEKAEGRAGTYRTQVVVTYRQKEGDGDYSINDTTFSIGSDTPLTPAEAMAEVQAVWGDDQYAHGDTEIYGLQYGGTIRNTGRAA
jgi:hypothetical protein